MLKIEWRLRAVTRYMLTRYEREETGDPAPSMRGTAVTPCGEFAELNLAMAIGRAMSAEDAVKFATRPGEVSVTFDSVHLPAPKVRAKMRCSNKQAFRDAQWPQDRDGGNVSLNAVYESGAADGGNAALENRIFSQATPSASVMMHIESAEAFDRFEPGRDYYVDFIPVPQPDDAVLVED